MVVLTSTTEVRNVFGTVICSLFLLIFSSCAVLTWLVNAPSLSGAVPSMLFWTFIAYHFVKR